MPCLLASQSPAFLPLNNRYQRPGIHQAHRRQKSVPAIGTTITPTFVSGTSKYVDVAAVEFTEPVPTQYWDRNDTTAGAGNPADGTWDASATNWNPLADGTGTVAAWSAGQKAVFAAGADATDRHYRG